ETGLPSAQGDRGMLEQVVMNLVLNARDAMPEGGRIQVETCSLQITAEYARQFQGRRPGQFVRLTVADNGCGMDAVTRQRIFEPFFTTKELGQGTGLGLATCYGIIQRHQGWMEVESTPGAGSRFHVFIPVAEGEPDTTPSMPKE
ncbi:MAG TPA: ATP-binding protein, partial [Verrucomicrobiae bacterium]